MTFTTLNHHTQEANACEVLPTLILSWTNYWSW